MTSAETLIISPARSPEDIEASRHLFSAYAQSLGIDLSFQDFPSELASLPGKYAPPNGEILLAKEPNGKAVGCVAVRPLPLHEACCEMKRLYVLPAGRGLGIGKKLVPAITEVATRLGYREIRLDTLPHMVEAVRLYENEGFVRTDPYYATPLTGTIFLAKELQARSGLD